MGPRRKYYVDPEIQFPIILTLIVLVMVEGVFVGWGVSKAAALARAWENPRQAAEFFRVLFLTIVPVVSLNFFLGAWLSNKIAGPLQHLRELMSEIARGNLEVEATVRRGDYLQAHVQEFNKMVQTLRRLIYRDQKFAEEVDEILQGCEEAAAKDAALRKSMKEARARLSVINAHFMKGRREERRRT
jgi:methyl-accepting chemotaxis protein